MAKITSKSPELEEVVVTALADYFNKNDKAFREQTEGDRQTARDFIRFCGVLDENPERIRVLASAKPIYAGYGYDIRDFIGKTKYNLALQIAKRKNGSEHFVAEGIEDNKCGWYITKIE